MQFSDQVECNWVCKWDEIPHPTLRLVGMQVIGPLNPLPGMPKHGLRHLITAAKPGKPCSNRATQIMGGPSQTAVQPKLVGT